MPNWANGDLKVKRIDMIFISALLLLSTMLLMSYQMKNKLVESNRWSVHTYDVLMTLDDLHHSLLEAESSRRGYVLTGNSHQKEIYLLAAQNVPAHLERLKSLTRDNTIQQQRLKKLSAVIDSKLSNLQQSIDAWDSGRSDLNKQYQLTEQGSLLMSMARAEIDAMKTLEEDLLKERRSVEQMTMRVLVLVFWGGILAAITILSVTFLVARREATDHRKAARDLGVANQDITNLSEMTQFLQSCATLQEASSILSHYAERFFPGHFGGIYLINSSRNLLSEVAVWGNFHSELFSPDQCWALRLGQAHVAVGDSDVKCSHIHSSADGYICIPLAAEHETLGVLHIALTSPEAVQQIDKKKSMAVAFGEQIALALRNLQLREQLRELSIRDPLTGLLNRRYLEESMQREMSRAFRKDVPLSVIMLDVDHFKQFNDTFGHEAGDHVLQEVGQLLHKQVRGSDIACRFGGEEFTLILPEADRAAARDKAEAIRIAVKGLQLISGKQSLGKVTISLGVASFPEDGETFQQLMARADAALYRAKASGRDRVEL